MAKINTLSASDPVTKQALAGLQETAPILQDIEFYTKSGPADSIKKSREGAEKSKITRSLNEDNTATPPTPVYEPVAKKIISFDAKVDRILEDRNEDAASELATQTFLEAKEAGWALQSLCFNGDVGADAENFDGLDELVVAGQIRNTDTNGIQIPVGGDAVKGAQQVAIETMLKHAAMVRGGATHMYMNEFLKIRWLTVAKSLGYYSAIDTPDGKVEKIADVIVRGAGYNKDGSLILPQSETVGSNADCSSIFFARWAEKSDLSALTSVGLKATYAGQVGNFYVNNVNMDMVLTLQNDTALMKSMGWRL